ncbi:hypothetical protein BH10ACT3_BH10ACT3_17920 [soil metagenome]
MPETASRQTAPAPWGWGSHTDPFSALDHPADCARFVVEQVGDGLFSIADGSGFQYNPSDGSAALVITRESLGETDFASIPPFMSWFVSRYGRHTPAALVHDQLVAPGITHADRQAADKVFLELMDASQVPPVRSRLMWAGVASATRITGGRIRALGIIVWALSAAAGVVLLVHGVATGLWIEVVVALLAPIPASFCWGSTWRAGLIAGFALPLVLVPAAVSWLAYAGYSFVEWAVRIVRRRLPQNRHEPLAKPVKYRDM